MRHLQRISAFTLIFVILACLVMAPSASAAVSETGTNVKFRVVLNNYMKFASCTVYVTELESMESDVAIDQFNFSVGRSDMWERTLTLSPGFYQITYISLIGSWNSELAGRTERFEVKGENMTVYAGLQSAESPVTLPDPWLVYGDDDQKFHIWDGTPGFIIDTPSDTSDPDISTPSLPGLPGDISTDVDENSAPHRPEAPTRPTTPDITSEQPIAPSARIGNIIFYILACAAIAVCAIILTIKARK